MRLVAAIVALAALTAPAVAEQLYACDGGSFITTNSYEARVSVPHNDGFTVAMPRTFDGDHLRVFSPHTHPVRDDFEIATPYVAVEFHSATTPPDSLSYDLGSGKIACAPIR